MIHYENINGIQRISMAIDKGNSFDLEAFKQFDFLLEKSKKEKSKILVLESSIEKVFSQGLNLQSIAGEPNDEILNEFLGYFFGILEKIYFYPKIVISQVSGHAMGYGAMMALASDFRFGLEGMRIGLPEVKIGIRVPAFIVQLLVDAIGKKEAFEHVLNGNALKTIDAYKLGLFHEIHPDEENLKNSVNKFINRITKNSISAMIDTKTSIRKLSTNIKEIIDFDTIATKSSIQSADAREGIEAAVVGRRPEFKD